MKRNIVIMDFSGIYQEEQFYEGEQISWIDLSDISGTNCYCDGDAQAQILERMEKYPVSGIYFIDSGNYHYMSRIGIGRVKEPFNLLVFDNHTDMQLPAFGGLLSCGGWIAPIRGKRTEARAMGTDTASAPKSSECPPPSAAPH